MAQRKREFGVRMALGASAWQIVWGMLIQTSRTGLIGLAVGLAVAAGVVRLLTASAAILDFGARPFVVGAATVLIATTVAALVGAGCSVVAGERLSACTEGPPGLTI
jgi:ABC-type antimicrobial peptide transport system permease subunit